MNRRDFLKGAVGTVALAATMPWNILSPTKAHAYTQTVNQSGKVIFNGLLHSNQPDMYALYGMPYIPNMNRTAVTGYAVSWPDPTDVPTSQWYDDAAVAYAAAAAISGWVFVDIETFPQSGVVHATNQASAAKFVTFFTEIKARMPGIKFGSYALPIYRNYDIHNGNDIESALYNAWAANNEDYVAMYSVLDALMPSLYFLPQNRATSSSGYCSILRQYLHRNIEIGRILSRLYNPGLKIYPFIWWRYDPGAVLLDQDIWEETVRTCLQKADGFVLWGGYLQDWNTDSLNAWWTFLEPHLTSRRFWARHRTAW